MPRGLGDNPLKREKKLRHTSSRASRSARQTAAGLEAGSALPVATTAPEVHSGPAPNSYNDVFFQRRTETLAQPSSPTQEAPTGAPAEASPDHLPVDAIETSPAPLSAVPVVATPVEPETALQTPTVEDAPAPVIETAPPSPPPVAEAAVSATQEAPEQEKKVGIFGRIFGKWRK